MTGELANEVETHLAWLRTVRSALLVAHVEQDRRHRHATKELEHAIGVAERLRARLEVEPAGRRDDEVAHSGR